MEDKEIKIKFNYIGSSDSLKNRFEQSINRVCKSGKFDMSINDLEFKSLKESMGFCLLNTSYVISNINLHIDGNNYYSIDVRSDDDLVCKIDTFKVTSSDRRLSPGDQDDIIC